MTVEGDVAAEDAVSVIASGPEAVTVADVVSLYASDACNQDLLRRVSGLSALPEDWRDYFRKRLWQPDEE